MWYYSRFNLDYILDLDYTRADLNILSWRHRIELLFFFCRWNRAVWIEAMSEQKTAGSLGLSEAPNTCHAGYLVNWFNVKSHLYRISKVYEYNMVQAMNLSKTFPSALVGKHARWATHSVSNQVPLATLLPFWKGSNYIIAQLLSVLTKLPFFAASLMQHGWISIPSIEPATKMHCPKDSRGDQQHLHVEKDGVQGRILRPHGMDTQEERDLAGLVVVVMGRLMGRLMGLAGWVQVEVSWVELSGQEHSVFCGTLETWQETTPFYERGPAPLPMIEMSQNRQGQFKQS